MDLLESIKVEEDIDKKRYLYFLIKHFVLTETEFNLLKEVWSTEPKNNKELLKVTVQDTLRAIQVRFHLLERN